MNTIFRSVNCENTSAGHLISWTLRKNYNALIFDVYHSIDNKEWILHQPHVNATQFLIPYGNQGLTAMYRVHATCDTGETDISDTLQPVYVKRPAVLILRKLRNDAMAMLKTNPMGVSDVHIFMRRYDGPVCPVCGHPNLDAGTNMDCPVCFGTGVENGYYLWPAPEPMQLLTPKDTKAIGTPQTDRSNTIYTFRTVFPGVLRTYDLLMIGNEIYDVTDKKVASSISGVPVTCILSCHQLMPDEPRYDALYAYLKQECDNAVLSDRY